MVDKKLFSKKISAGTRVYYLDVDADAKGQPYLSISEIATDKAPEKKRRQQIFVHSENLNAFAKALEEVISFIKKDAEG